MEVASSGGLRTSTLTALRHWPRQVEEGEGVGEADEEEEGMGGGVPEVGLKWR